MQKTIRRLLALVALALVLVACGTESGPQAAAEASLMSSATTVSSGAEVTLTWEVKNAASARLSSSNTSVLEPITVDLAGTTEVNVIASTVFTVTALDRNGRVLASADAAVTVRSPGTPPVDRPGTDPEDPESPTPDPEGPENPTTVVIQELVLGPRSGTIPVGATLSLTARAFDVEGELLPDVEFEFSTGDSNVLSVNEAGQAVAVGVGEATVIVKADGSEAEASFIVTPASTALPGLQWEMTAPRVMPSLSGFDQSGDGRMYATLNNPRSAGGGSGAQLLSSIDGGLTWQPIYSGDVNRLGCGTIQGLVVSPVDSDILLLSCTSRRQYLRSDDAGRTWSAVYTEAGTGALALPVFLASDSNVVRAEGNVSYDAGTTWSESGVSSAWWVSPDDPLNWWIDSSASSIRETLDGGATWNDIAFPPMPTDRLEDRCTAASSSLAWEWINGVAVSSEGTITIYGRNYCWASWPDPPIPDDERYQFSLFTREANGSWNEMHSVLTSAGVSRFGNRQLRYSLVGSDVLYAIGNTLGGIASDSLMVSTNRGVDWHDYPAPVNLRNLILSPFDAGTMLAQLSGGSYYLTRDYGQSWNPIGMTSTPRFHYGAGGVYVYGSGFAGLQFFDWDSGERTQVPGLTGLTGAQDGQGIAHIDDDQSLSLVSGNEWSAMLGARSYDRGETWQDTFTPSFRAVQSQARPSRWYFATGKGDIRLSDDGGESYVLAGRLPNLAIPTVLAASHTNPDRVYALTGTGVYRSDDAGSSWVWASTNLAQVSVPAMVVDPRNDDVVYVGGAGVFKTTNAGVSWNRMGNGLHSDWEPWISVLAISSDGSTLFAGVNGGSVFRSLDAGGTWEWVNSGFESYSVQDIVIDPTDDNVIYVSTTGGVYKSTDRGSSWLHASHGLFTPFMTWLTVSADGSTLYLGTEDHGIYRAEVSGDTGHTFTTMALDTLLHRERDVTLR